MTQQMFHRPPGRIRRAIACGALIALAFGLAAGCKSVPEGQPGASADALAKKMLKAINYDAWLNQTAAVSWTFRGTNEHFWDRQRDLVEVRWDDGEYVARFNKNTKVGRVYRNGKEIKETGEQAELLAKANAYFVNDAFWLNPLYHIESPGVQLELVGERSLKVTFASGGVTPGDVYLFHTDEAGLVTAMQLWVSIVPFKGSEATFEDYAVSATGAKSARRYDYLITITIDDLKMFAQYPERGGDDRFVDILN